MAVSHTEGYEKEKLFRTSIQASPAEEWLEQFKLGSNSVRFRTCFHGRDGDTPV